MSALRRWLDAATADQKIRLAAALKLKNTVYLQHLASGRRKARGGNASLIRRAAARFTSLPALKQRELSDDCAQCDYAKRCEK